MVSVDGRRKVVWDSAEPEYPILLNAEAMRLCCGVRLTKNVEDRLLEVVEQRVRKPQKPTEVVEI